MMSQTEFTKFCLQIGLFETKTIKELFESLKDVEGNTGTVSMYMFVYV